MDDERVIAIRGVVEEVNGLCQDRIIREKQKRAILNERSAERGERILLEARVLSQMLINNRTLRRQDIRQTAKLHGRREHLQPGQLRHEMTINEDELVRLDRFESPACKIGFSHSIGRRFEHWPEVELRDRRDIGEPPLLIARRGKPGLRKMMQCRSPDLVQRGPRLAVQPLLKSLK